MSQIQTTIGVKNNVGPNNTLTASEFNEINESVVNGNSTDLETRLVALSAENLSLDNRTIIIEDTDTSDIQKYNSDTLPTGLTDGTIAFDASSQVPVYSLNDQWYRLSNDLLQDNLTEVDHFVIMGQSNALGKDQFTNLSGSIQSKDRTGILYYGSTATGSNYWPGTWGQYTPGSEEGTAGEPGNDGTCGLDVGLGDKLKEFLDDSFNTKFTNAIAMSKHARGGSALYDNWDPDASNNHMYRTMEDMLPKSQFELAEFSGGRINNVKAFIWYQGESDASAGQTTAQYEANLIRFIADVRARYNKPTLPFITCMPWHQSNLSSYAEIRNAMINVAASDTNTYVMETSAYSPLDNFHIDSEGQYDLGTDIANLLNTTIL